MTDEIKPLCVIRAPCETRSGYGDMSRDIIRHFIEYDKYEVLVHSVPWGDTPMNALNEDTPMNTMISERIMKQAPNRPIDLFVSITVPNEFEAHGKYNIGITAGIETTQVSPPWLAGCNKMDLILTISEHSSNVFQISNYSTQDGSQSIKLEKPIEVLHNCVHTDVFGKKAPVDFDMKKVLDGINENYCFLFVGHWLKGDFNQDRKNVGGLIKIFFETFRQVKDKNNKRPALILKTSSAGFSILDREEMLSRIEAIKNTVILQPGEELPNVYLMHGDLTEKEMNTLYNHEKVKTHVSFTKGEGFGRPLLEASVSQKPIVASGWSGHMDFLDKDRALLVGGELTNVHESAAWENVIMKEASWFTVDVPQAMNAMAAVFVNYKDYRENARKLGMENFKKFSYEQIKQNTFDLLDKYVPEFPKQVQLKLPELKKIELPKLEKVE